MAPAKRPRLQTLPSPLPEPSPAGLQTLPSSTSPDQPNHDAAAAASPWPSLPVDLLPAIAGRLTALEDFFSLRAACRAYLSRLPATPATLRSQAPLLLLLPFFPSFSEALFDLPRRHLLRFRLPWPFLTRRTVSSSHGFLVTTSSTGPYKILLLRLFSGEQLRLPKTPCAFTRVLLSPSGGGLLAVLFTPHRRTLQSCRSGDALWLISSVDAHQVLHDLLFLNGTLFALLSPGCCLATVDLSDDSPPQLSVLGGEFTAQSGTRGCRWMLGECGGELLLISEELSEVWDVSGYRVFRWEFGPARWVQVHSLGGRALFLGDDGFAACIVPNCAGIRRDCIYAAGCRSGQWYEFSLEDGSLVVCYAEYAGSPAPDYVVNKPPVWVFPSLC